MDFVYALAGGLFWLAIYGLILGCGRLLRTGERA